ncbi:next to BRCA1 gene 1 protein-like [Ornithodoros turicata]|uniref:next to BRCA1 gene 1 protein-like n=1 Tax=Ornithodoros turicata TaxID=34597 RepID=UPI00313A0934
MRISAACVDDENYVNMSETRIEVDFTPQPVRFQLSVPQQSTWDAVKDAVLAGCGASEESVRLTYADDEEERIQLSSDLEMQEAFRVAAKQGNVLKIQVVETSNVGGAAPKKVSRSYREKESGEFVFVNGSDDATVQASQTDNDDTPPAWFRKYVTALRDQLREEVTEEVCRRLASNKADKSTDVRPTDKALTYREGATCGNCLDPIQGVCYKCWECPNFDLCEACESLPSVHDASHSLLKMRKQIATQGYRRKRHSVGSHRPIRSPSRQSAGREMKQEKKIQKLMKKLEKYNLRDANVYRQVAPGTEKCLNLEPYGCEFVCDDTIPDWTHVQPGTRFTKRWRVRNSGYKSWDKSVSFQYRWGTLGLMPSDTATEAPPVASNEEGTLEIQFTAPLEPGQYQTHWRMCGPEGFFGHRLWCNVIVDPALTLEPQLKHMASLKVVQGPDDDTAPEQASKTDDLLQLKTKIVSQTATPYNSPAGMTPLKSPETSDAEDESSKVGGSEISILDMPLHHDTEESASVLSLSSVDTEADFEVVPLPPCFNLNIPFTASAAVKQDAEHGSEGDAARVYGLAPSCEVLCEPSKSAESASDVPQVPPRKSTLRPNIYDDSPSDSDSGRSSSGSDNTIPVRCSFTESVEQRAQSMELAEKKEENKKDAAEEGEDTSAGTSPGSTKKPFSSRKTYKVEGVGEALPEAWVNGALSAAATVYNTAKTVFSGIQQQDGLSSPRWIPPAGHRAAISPMERLLEMGFANRQRNSELLRKHDGDVQRVVEELVSNEGNWLPAHAEGPPSPRPFMCSFD